MSKKVRLDQAVVDQGLAADVAEAKRLIMAGQVLVGDQRHDKAGVRIAADAPLRLKRKQGGRYVSRAGGKLAGALDTFGLSVAGKTCLDLGASTGGFTDCLLQNGARKVYAVDVGTNQLVWQLRTDERVVSLEQTHARDLNTSLVPEPIEVLVVDVSFTSLRYVLPPTEPLLARDAQAICLFKPQFEVARSLVKEGGLVDEQDAQHTMSEMLAWCEANGWQVSRHIKSPVKGLSGNQEYLLHMCPKAILT